MQQKVKHVWGCGQKEWRIKEKIVAWFCSDRPVHLNSRGSGIKAADSSILLRAAWSTLQIMARLLPTKQQCSVATCFDLCFPWPPNEWMTVLMQDNVFAFHFMAFSYYQLPVISVCQFWMAFNFIFFLNQFGSSWQNESNPCWQH